MSAPIEVQERFWSLRRLVGGGLFGAAAAAAYVVTADFNAAAAARALADASAQTTPEAQSMALERFDAAVRSGSPSGELSELAATRALFGDAPDLEAAETWTREALARSPARAAAWARLAYIDLARDGELGPDGVAALAHSYAVEPYSSGSLRQWRIELTLERWSTMPEALRAAAIEDARGSASGQYWYEETVWLEGLATRLPAEAAEALRAALPTY